MKKYTTTEYIDPHLAAEYLERNTLNRAVRAAKVAEYAADMRLGRWHDTGQGIIFDETGTLIDGQHRLLAIIESGIGVHMDVIRGVSRSAMAYIDVGAKRSTNDYLHLHHGVPDSNRVGGAIKSILSTCFWFQNFVVKGETAFLVYKRFGKEIHQTTSEIGNFKPAMKSWIIGTIAFARKSHPEEMSKFAKGIGNGENLKKGDPAFAVRNWLIGNAVKTMNAGYKRTAIEGILNAAYRQVRGEDAHMIKRGAVGLDYFKANERHFIEKMRTELSDYFELRQQVRKPRKKFEGEK